MRAIPLVQFHDPLLLNAVREPPWMNYILMGPSNLRLHAQSQIVAECVIGLAHFI